MNSFIIVKECFISYYTTLNRIEHIELEACNLTKSQITSLDFVLNRFFMKLFGTNSIKVITECQTYFSFKLPSTLLAEQVKKLKDDYQLQGHGG